jgi:hypothetical protein
MLKVIQKEKKKESFIALNRNIEFNSTKSLKMKNKKLQKEKKGNVDKVNTNIPLYLVLYLISLLQSQLSIQKKEVSLH